MDEHTAIIQLKEGDIAGLEVLVRLHQHQAIKTAYLIVRDTAQAEDITQTAFLKVYERIQQFDQSRPFAPWFLRIVANEALMTLRHPSASLDDAPDIPDDLPSLYEKLEALETQAAVRQSLGQLAPLQRAAVVMRYYLDFSDAEIAASLQVPSGTVRRRLHDARQRLRQVLPDWVRPDTPSAQQNRK